MAEFILMPKLGFDMREAVLLSWLKNVGDTIEKGEVIAEIESDKATLTLEAQSSGTLLQTLAEADDVVAIGGKLAIVGRAGEDLAAMLSEAEAEAPARSASTQGMEHEEAQDVAPTAAAPAVPSDGRLRATPLARRMARESGIDLRLVTGTGPEGRIRKVDLEGYLAGAPAAAPYQPAISAPTGPATEEVKLTRLRQAIGRRMATSKSPIPHFYVTSAVDMKAALDLRRQLNDMLTDERRVTVNDLIVKACGLALREFPNINATFAGDKLIRHNRINVGTAVAVPGGLLTVVQKNTDLTPLPAIALENREMIARVREGKSFPADFADSTFTVSNLGAYDVDHFIAIINPPEAAILAVGTAQEVAVVEDGQLTVGLRMKATISADHRVTDGAEAAQFLQRFRQLLEKPLTLFPELAN